MERKDPRFSHRDKFSSYMAVALAAAPPAGPGGRSLDIPAGSGHVGHALAALGYQHTNADINGDQDDFVFADMNRDLPFPDANFDLVTCLEGIEHVLDPFHLVGELARVTKPGGRVIISTPNPLNLYSRLQFFFTGTFYHFAPNRMTPVRIGEVRDPWHISPMTYHRLRYVAEHHGLTVAAVHTDRYKKKWTAVFLPLVHSLGRLWGRRLLLPQARSADRSAYRHSFSAALLLGRTMVMVLDKSA
jgi:SAM-dependent methyltransferase